MISTLGKKKEKGNWDSLGGKDGCSFTDKADIEGDDMREVGWTRTHRAQCALCVNKLGFFFK